LSIEDEGGRAGLVAGAMGACKRGGAATAPEQSQPDTNAGVKIRPRPLLQNSQFMDRSRFSEIHFT
jgi:hypothetical protein